MKIRSVVALGGASTGALAQYGSLPVPYSSSSASSSMSPISTMATMPSMPAVNYLSSSSSSSGTPTISPVYITTTIDDCDSATPETMITITDGVTVTYCPKCEMEASMSSATRVPEITGHTTVYTTYYQSLCTDSSTWFTTPQVYTVTESCTMATPSWSSGPNYVPQGFTTTVMECSMCESSMDVTITMPCGCDETEGASTPATAAASVTGATPPTAAATPTWTPVSNGTAPAGYAATGVAPGSAPTMASEPAPYPMTTTPKELAPAPSTWASGVTYGNTSNITPYAGAASELRISGLLSAVVLGIAGLAYLL